MRTFTPRYAVPLLALLLVTAITQGQESFTGKVVSVTDGDTIQVMHNGRAKKIRLWGIDTPEKAQAFGTKAKQFTSEQAFGKVVTVEVKDTDRYGRTVGVVTLPNGRLLNRELVSNGLAWWYEQYAPNDRALKRLHINAEAKKRGLWSNLDPVAPWDFRKDRSAPPVPKKRGGELKESLTLDERKKLYIELILAERRSMDESESLTTSNLNVGDVFRLSKRTPLMPKLEFGDDMGQFQEIFGAIKYLPEGLKIRVDQVTQKGTWNWYKVSVESIGLSGWINGVALIGQGVIDHTKESLYTEVDLQRQLQALYTAELAKRWGLTPDRVIQIGAEGVGNGWPRP